jgi:hypothetical protein
MADAFQQGRVPWWNAPRFKPEGIVRLDDKCLGLRVRLPSGERATMPLGRATFEMLFPR